MLPLLSINWDPNPELFNLFGHIPVRYYGLLWVIGIACSYFVVRYQYRDKKINKTTCFSPYHRLHLFVISGL